MAVKSKEEILAKIRERVGEDTSDDVIELIEDVTDTIDSLAASGNPEGKDWKAEAERIDKEWRDKYITRFTQGSPNDEPIVKKIEPEAKDYSFENLFK